MQSEDCCAQSTNIIVLHVCGCPDPRFYFSYLHAVLSEESYGNWPSSGAVRGRISPGFGYGMCCTFQSLSFFAFTV